MLQKMTPYEREHELDILLNEEELEGDYNALRALMLMMEDSKAVDRFIVKAEKVGTNFKELKHRAFELHDKTAQDELLKVLFELI